MKRLLVFLCLSIIVLSSCDRGNASTSKENFYTLTLINSTDYLITQLEESYKGNTLIRLSTHTIQNADLNIYLNEEKITQESKTGTEWFYFFYMPNRDSVLEFKVESDNPYYGDSLSNYVEVKEIVIPSADFECEMVEVNKETAYYLVNINSIVGLEHNKNFEYGYLCKSDTPEYRTLQSINEINSVKETDHRNNRYIY